MTKTHPFKFLDAYNQSDTDIFFGRDEEVEALYQMIFQSDMLLVYGASGTGKTSLINCGLAGRFQVHDWLALNIRRAVGLTDTLRQLLGGSSVNLDQDTLTGIRNYLKNTNAARYNFLKNRYFPEMVEVPGGTMDGKVIAGFRMAKYETTNWHYNLFCLYTGQDSIKRTQAGWGVGGNVPVVNVSWEDALRYANWLSRYESLKEPYSNITASAEWDTTSTGYRLPTEVEWEYAARNGIRQDTFKYSGSDSLDLVGWYRSNSNGRPHEVGTKKGNDLSLFDMSGNVWEWCWDTYSEAGSARVIRGGGWLNNATYCRVSYRNYTTPDYRINFFGFRLVSSLRFNGQ